ncbi:hypothetical protein B0H13DRAFT_2553523 [Mycena leptocephala]|nr:hypothetical protein B0H13DRAFT_2553523 [Mycena leptocephala]
MATDDIGSHDSSNGWLLSCPFPSSSSPLRTSPASSLSAVSGLGCLVSLLFLKSSQGSSLFFNMFSRKSSDPQDFSQGFNPNSCEPTSLKNHGFPQGFNHLLENAVNSPQVVKNICAQACEYYAKFVPSELVTCPCGEPFQTRVHILRECETYAWHREILQKVSEDISMPEILATEKGLQALALFLERTGAFTKTGRPRSDEGYGGDGGETEDGDG